MTIEADKISDFQGLVNDFELSHGVKSADFRQNDSSHVEGEIPLKYDRANEVIKKNEDKTLTNCLSEEYKVSIDTDMSEDFDNVTLLNNEERECNDEGNDENEGNFTDHLGFLEKALTSNRQGCSPEKEPQKILKKEKNLKDERAKSYYMKHFEKYVTPEDYKISKCTTCHIKYNHRQDLLSHIQIKHNGIRWQCSFCPYKATLERYLKFHIKNRHSNVNNQVECPQCGGMYASNANLKLHIKSIHEKIVHYCDQCNFKTSIIYILKEHVDYKHKGIVKYACKHCDYSTHRKYNLDVHQKNMHLN